MNDLLTRVLTAVVAGLIFIFCLFNSWQSYTIVFLILALLGLHEYRKAVNEITPIKEDIYDTVYFWMNGFCIYLVTAFVGNGMLEGKFNNVTLILLLLPIIVKNHFLPKYTWKDAAAYLGGYLWIVIPFGLTSALAWQSGAFNRWLLFYILVIIWVHDSMAYFVGKKFGNIKLMPSVSPNKTIEGFLGGAISAILISLVVYYFDDSSLSYWNWLSIGTVVAIFATIGDLLESRLKRLANIKDTGRLLPGHGGILDRFDALFITLPIILVLIKYVFR